MTRSEKKRFRALVPGGVPRYVRVYDNNNESVDRYSVVFTGNYRGTGANRSAYQYLGMSAAPFHPQGFCQHGESQDQIDVNRSGFAPAIGRKNHLGKRITFADLPGDCQSVVMRDYRAIWNLNEVSN